MHAHYSTFPSVLLFWFARIWSLIFLLNSLCLQEHVPNIFRIVYSQKSRLYLRLHNDFSRRLGKNKLSSVPELSGMSNLRSLHLEGNIITELSPTIFGPSFQPACTRDSASSVPCLEKLFLQDNKLTELKPDIFNGVPKLQQLHLEVNPNLKLLPPGLFTVFTKTQAVISMQGSDSVCEKVTQDEKVQCACALGYVGDEHCTRVPCPDRIGGLIEEATAECTSGGEVLAFEDTCTASCKEGFAGNPVEYTCQANGKWGPSDGGTGAACTAVVCEATPDTQSNNFSLECSGNLRFDGTPCEARCDTGFKLKDPKSSLFFTCQQDESKASDSVAGKWISVDVLSGRGEPECIPHTCASLIESLDTDRTTYKESKSGGSNTLDNCGAGPFANSQVAKTGEHGKCYAQCKPGYQQAAIGISEFFCNENGEWVAGTPESPLPPLECKGQPCGRNPTLSDPNAVSRCRGDTTVGGDPCVVRCKVGYRQAGDDKYPEELTCSSDSSSDSSRGVWSQSNLKCKPTTCSKYMTDVPGLSEAVDDASIDCSAGHSFGDKCNVGCKDGFAHLGVPGNTVDFSCESTARSEGIWVGEIDCATIECGPNVTNLIDSAAQLIHRGCGEGVQWDPKLERCSENNRYGARREASCTEGFVQETRELFCGDEGWQVVPIETSSVYKNYQTINRFCRGSCGVQVSSRWSLCDDDSSDLGVGSTCSMTCLSDTSLRVRFVCSEIDGFFVWTEAGGGTTSCAGKIHLLISSNSLCIVMSDPHFLTPTQLFRIHRFLLEQPWPSLLFQ